MLLVTLLDCHKRSGQPKGQMERRVKLQALTNCLQPFLAGMSAHELAAMSPTCYAHDVSSGFLDGI